MIPLFLSTIISCNDAIKIINRVVMAANLSFKQKTEIVAELRKLVPTCPITIKKDEPSKK